MEIRKNKLVKIINDYSCIIKVWEYVDYSGRKQIFNTVHPKFK